MATKKSNPDKNAKRRFVSTIDDVGYGKTNKKGKAALDKLFEKKETNTTRKKKK